MKPLLAILFLITTTTTLTAEDRWIVFEGKTGPGVGKHIVLISGDDEYRSEEALPQLAKILTTRHGFRCTVLFSQDDDGTINPEQHHNQPGLEALDTADLAILGLRFRDWPDEQMAHFVNYVDSGKPIIGLRTSTHAFDIKDENRKYHKYTWTSKVAGYEQGFGRQVLGETWINHHGHHGKQSTRGIVVKGQESNPLLRGIHEGDVWGPTDVYGVRLPLPADCQPILLGQVVDGMSPNDPPATDGKKNDPMLPIAWTNSYHSASGKTARIFCTTMGAATDFENEGLRRLIVNASYWALGMDDKIPEQADVALVGEYKPSPFRFGGYRKGMKPVDYSK